MPGSPLIGVDVYRAGTRHAHGQRQFRLRRRAVFAMFILASVFAVAAFPHAAGAQVPQPPPNGNCEGTAVVAKLGVVEDRAAANMLAEAADILGFGERCLVDAGEPTSGRVPSGSRNELSNAVRVFVVGGPAAIPHDWLTSTLGVTNYTRIAGGNRWDTQSAVVSAIISLSRGAPVIAYAGQPSSTPDLPPNTGCTNAVAVKLNVVEDTAAANMLAEAFNKLSDGGDDRCLVDVGDPRTGTTPTSRAKDDYDYAEMQYVIGGTTAIPNSWMSAHFSERNYERLAGADRWGTQESVAREIVEMVPPSIALSADDLDHVTDAGARITQIRSPDFDIRSEQLYVYWCGQAGGYNEANHVRQIRNIQQQVADGLIARELGSAGFEMEFIAAGPLYPSAVSWQTSLTKWHAQIVEDNNGITEDPCTRELVRVLKEASGSADQPIVRNAFILVDIETGPNVAGYAWKSKGPAIMPTLEQFIASGESEDWFYVTFAHELGHGFYGLSHIWKGYGQDEDPGRDCKTASWWHLLSTEQKQSLMSYPACGARLQIERSYIACNQKIDLIASVAQSSSETCEGVQPPVVDIDEPDESQIVQLFVGSSAQGQPGCGAIHCRWLRIEVDEEAITRELGSGPFSVVCAHEAFAGYGVEYGHGAWSSNFVNHFPYESGCYFGYPGVDVFVVIGAEREGDNWIGGVYSERLRWPDCNQEPGRCMDRGSDGASIEISWGTDATERRSVRTGERLCPTGQRCTNLLYQMEGLGNGPYSLTCGVDSQSVVPFQWSGNPETGCLFWGSSGQAWVEVNGHRSNLLPLSTRLTDGNGGSRVTISWGTDGSNRSGICPANIRCTNLAYQIEGLGNGPWRLNCGDDAGGITPFLWSGNPATGCLFWGSSGNVWVEVDGHRSNSLPRSTRPR